MKGRKNMNKSTMFPDEIAEILREHDRSGAIVRIDLGYKTRAFTAGQLNYGLYASDRLYRDSETGKIVQPLAVALLVYDAIEAGGTAYIDDYRIQ